jgi:hypothetical protein
MGLERRGGRMFGLFLWGVKNVKGQGHRNTRKTLMNNVIKFLKKLIFEAKKHETVPSA